MNALNTNGSTPQLSKGPGETQGSCLVAWNEAGGQTNASNRTQLAMLKKQSNKKPDYGLSGLWRPVGAPEDEACFVHAGNQ